MKEVHLGRVAGPFEKISYDNFIQSPIRLVPKAGGDQTRLIFHLLYNFKRDGYKSLNFHAPKQKCSVKYRDLDHTVQAFLRLAPELMQENNEDNSSNDRKCLHRRWKAKFQDYQRK